MRYTTLISVEQLQALEAAGTPHMVFDCTFDLMKPESGAAQYAAAHIPGAVYANLDTDLSAPHGVPGKDGQVIVAEEDGEPSSGGRHPLPSREKFATWLSSVGFANGMQAVVYDRNGANYCGRLWWMLKWMGHDAVAVLDGGLQAWQAAGGAVTDREEPTHFQSNFVAGDALLADQGAVTALFNLLAQDFLISHALQWILAAHQDRRTAGRRAPTLGRMQARPRSRSPV